MLGNLSKIILSTHVEKLDVYQNLYHAVFIIVIKIKGMI